MKKIAIIFVILGLFARTAMAQDSNVQAPVLCNTASATSLMCAYGSSVTAGHVLVAAVATGGSLNYPSPVTDSLTDSWGLVAGVNRNFAAFMTTANSSGSNTVNVTLTGAAFSISIYIYERSSLIATLDPVGPIAGSGKPTSTTFACDALTGTPSLTTSYSLDTVFCIIAPEGGTNSYNTGPADDNSSPPTFWNDDGHFTGVISFIFIFYVCRNEFNWKFRRVLAPGTQTRFQIILRLR